MIAIIILIKEDYITIKNTINRNNLDIVSLIIIDIITYYNIYNQWYDIINKL